MIKKQNVIHIILFGLVTAFFIWRAFTWEDGFHIGAAIVYAVVTLTVILDRLPSAWRGNLLNLGIGLVFLSLVFAGINLEEVSGAFAQANYWLLIPSVLALLVHLVIRIWRWQWLLKPMAEVPFGPAFRAGMIGIGGNMVLPARAGEFLRAYVIGRSSDISKTGAFATLVVERIFDGLTVLLMLILLFIFGVRDPELQPYAIAGATFYAIALVGVIVFMLNRGWFERLLERLLPENVASKLIPLIQNFADGLATLRDMRQLIVVSILSLVTWAIIPISFYPVLAAFDYGQPLPSFAPILVLPMIAFGLMIPGPPGGLGPFHAFGNLGLIISFQIAGTPLTTEQEAIVTASIILLHLVQVIPEAALGLWAFFQEGLTTSDLKAGQSL
ncbi:MAG: lysylphosphatidylglycerol synthase transmembrane domain-containing protein [Chloroflexota bacterium]